MLHGTVEQHSEQRAGPSGGRPCAQTLLASPEQEKAWELAQVRVLHGRLAHFTAWHHCSGLAFSAPLAGCW